MPVAVILGMHRGGTSVLTRTLHEAGLSLGSGDQAAASNARLEQLDACLESLTSRLDSPAAQLAELRRPALDRLRARLHRIARGVMAIAKNRMARVQL